MARWRSRSRPRAECAADARGTTREADRRRIRPEALDETGGRDGDERGRLRGIVQAVEALGAEQLVHMEIDAKPVLVEDVLEGLVDVKQADDLAEIIGESEGGRAVLVARLDPSARLREGDPVELAVDLRKLHFFDLDSGEAIGA